MNGKSKIQLMKATQILQRNFSQILIVLGVAGIGLMYLCWDPIIKSNLFDAWDLEHYFQYSQWAAGQGVLYRDVYSDYLLLANLLFGCFRFLAEYLHPLSTSYKSFTWLWLSVTWSLYLWVTYIIYTQISKRSLWLWLAPSSFYFALFRYEIYLVLLTIFFLFSLRQEKYVRSALFLGFLIALKGYGLFLIPVYAVFMFNKQGFWQAVKLTLLSLTPFILSHVVVLLYAGLDGVIMPYRFQGNRPNTAETIYSAFYFLTFQPGWPAVSPRVGQAFQLFCALGAAALWPKTFDEWIDASLVAMVGFVTFGTVNSPQFFMWFLPIAFFSQSYKIRLCAGLLAWVTFLNYPIAQYLGGSKILNALKFPLNPNTTWAAVFMFWLFRPVIVVLTAVRLSLLYFSVRRLVLSWQGKTLKEDA